MKHSWKTCFDQKNAPHRPGVIAVVVLGVVLMASTVTVGIAHSVLSHHQEMERREWRVQANLLARAGLDRITQMPKVNGKPSSLEPWEPLLPETAITAKVRYELQSVANSEEQRIQVIAEVHVGPNQIIQSQLSGVLP
ncbi:MAG TPA: hypothetical protein VNQ76_20530 [Planctomicrobium sp.]|nr:hypothetical protein [Planctomicrobium sp.]